MKRNTDTTRKTSTGTICPICMGSGWKISTDTGSAEYECAIPCTCGARKRMQLDGRTAFAAIPEMYRDIRLGQFDLNAYQASESRELMKLTLDCIRYWLEHFEKMQKDGMGLYLFSEAKGSGKTKMAACIVNELICEKEVSVKFATSMQILDEIKKSWEKKSEQSENALFGCLANADILVIDDFGTEEQEKAWIREKFYSIINSRYVAKKATIFTSNYPVSALSYDERITNRIKESTYQLPFPEESIRVQIAAKNMSELMAKVYEYQGMEGEQLDIPKEFLEEK